MSAATDARDTAVAVVYLVAPEKSVQSAFTVSTPKASAMARERSETFGSGALAV